DFKSRNEDRISVSEVPLLTPAELVTLPKGQAFALLEGGQLWKLRMPLPIEDEAMPENLAEIASDMERTYITNDHWYRVQEPWWTSVADIKSSISQEESSDG
ncbi:MAG: conjugative coupling factor TraD, PFGI-1 class, partial [Gammaproteobacteria bacterium]|nr:conjugative coupling factor TraD, PFGI-1 class [Gammaproteobacteria bacterium]